MPARRASPPRCCTSASCCCSRPRWASCTSPAAPRPKLAHIGGLLAVGGLATLPGLLVTDFYDLALAQALPRAQSVEIADAAAAGWAPALMFITGVLPGLHRHRRAGRRRRPGGRRPALDAVRAGRRLAAAAGERHRARARPSPARLLIGRRVRHDRRARRADERSGVGRAAGSLRARRVRRRRRSRSRAPPERGDGGHPRAGVRLGHAGGRKDVPPLARTSRPARLVDLGMELDAPGEAADAEALRAAALWPFVDLDAPGRRLEAVLVPVQGVGVRRGCAPSTGSSAITRERGPGDEAAFGRWTFSPPRRPGEQLRAEADAEERDLALDGRADELDLGLERRVPRGLLAAEGDDPVDAVEVGQLAAEVLLDRARAARRRCRGTAAADGG